MSPVLAYGRCDCQRATSLQSRAIVEASVLGSLPGLRRLRRLPLCVATAMHGKPPSVRLGRGADRNTPGTSASQFAQRNTGCAKPPRKFKLREALVIF